MKIFIDTADLDEIKKAHSWGILDGITTNPSLIKKAVDKLKKKGNNIKIDEYIKKLCLAVEGPVSLEVKATKYNDIIREGKILYEKFNPINKNVVIKVPINTAVKEEEEEFEGIKAIKYLEENKIPVNVTLVMSPEQALMAAKAKATYVSPFLGRIDDYIRQEIGIEFQKEDYYDFKLIKKIEEHRLHSSITTHDTLPKLYKELSILKTNDNGIYSGVSLIESIIKIYKSYNFRTKIIAASIRNSRQVREIAEIGVDIATLPFYVIKQLVRHCKTAEGVKKFSADIVPEYGVLFN